MAKSSLLLGLTVLYLGIGACSATDDDRPETIDEFCERWARAACSPEVVSACQAPGPEECRASQRVFCSRELSAAGLAFSGRRAESCLEAIEAAYEDADLTADEIGVALRFDAPCDQLVRGPGGSGEVCTSRIDCEASEGLDCVFKGDQATGSCRLPQRVGAGQDCSAPGAVCDPGFYCDGENCIAGERIGEPCVSSRQCDPAAFCGLTSVCEARFAVGTTCGFDEQCASGLCYRFSGTEQVCTDRLRLSRSEPHCNTLR